MPVFAHLSISSFLFPPSPLCLSCVHNAPLKAGLHVLPSDWLPSKTMMSFLVGRCVSPPMHTHSGGRTEGRNPGSQQRAEGAKNRSVERK